MNFQEVCRLAELPEGTARRVEIDGVEICLARVSGQIYAVHDVCSHAEVALSEGDIHGCFIECWLHGSRFDLRTGEPTGPPASEAVEVYPVRVEGVGEAAVIAVSVDPVMSGVGAAVLNSSVGR